MCGEKVGFVFQLACPLGSPPHVRGKVAGNLEQGRVVGITPAYAGKRWWTVRSSWPRRDHPRVCGEKVHRRAGSGAPGGSPPRVREKKSLFTRFCPQMGSPPRVRGKVHFLKVRLNERGITPACAGKSSIQHLTASLGEFKVQKGHPVPHLRQRLQVWPDHTRHLRHGLILHASRSAGQGHRPCRAPCPDTAGSGTPRGPSPAKRPHTSPPAATPAGCRAWQSGATAPGSR